MIDLILPSAVVLVILSMAVFIRRKQSPFKKANSFFAFLLLLWCLYLAQWVLTPINGSISRENGVNIIPFKTIGSYLVKIKQNGIFTGADVKWTHFFEYGLTAAVKNLGANILFFIPMGLLIPLTFRNTKLHWYIFWSLLIPLFIELWQYLLCPSRSCDVDDLILNTIGIWLGMLPVLNIGLKRRPGNRTARKS